MERTLLARGLSVAVLLLAAASGGCVLHVHREGLPPPTGFTYSPDAPENPVFAYQAAGPVKLGEPVESTRTHDLIPLSFPSSGKNGHPENLVEGLYFRSRDLEPKKLVVVMPIWGTSTYPPDKISHGYAKHAGKDTDVIWIYGTAPLFPWEELWSAPTEEKFEEMARDSAERYRASVVDMRRLLDWAATQPQIDSSRIGFVGFSMSALVTATLLGNDSRVAAAVIMMGAANFGDVFANCHDKAGRVRDHAMRTFGWTLDQYRDFFRALFGPADPMRYAGHYDPSKILMIDAMFDDCMPESSRAALWEVTGHPERITLLYQHRMAFYSLTPLGLNFSRRKIYAFLDKTLDPKKGRNAAR